MSVVQERGNRTILTIDESEIAQARIVCSSLAEGRRTAAEIEFEVGPAGGQMVRIPADLAGLIREVIDGVSRGAAMSIHPLPRELTTTTAARMLGISRPTLMKLIAQEKLPAHKVGSHTRLSASDVLTFREGQREAQRSAFDELRKLDEEIGTEP